MGVFNNTKYFPVKVDDLSVVVDDLITNFQVKGFEVVKEDLLTGGYLISISKGGIFKSVLGMKTALNVELDQVYNGVKAVAKVGVFGQQIIPTAVTLFFAWPVMLTQIWGLVKNAKLDDEALDCIGESIKRHSLNADINTSDNNTGESNVAPMNTAAGDTSKCVFCTNCGTKISAAAKFCPECGLKQTSVV